MKPHFRRTVVAAAVTPMTVPRVALHAQTPSQIEAALEAAYEKYKGLQEGKMPTTFRRSRRWTRTSTASRS